MSSYKRAGEKRASFQLFRKAEIDQLQMPLGINEDILGFQISICDAFLVMEEFEDQADLSGVEACGRFFESAMPSEVGKDLASGAIIQLRTER